MPSHRDRSAFPSLPAEAALSLLKDTKGTLIWSARDLADVPKIKRREAEQALVFLQAQDYVQPAHQRSICVQCRPVGTGPNVVIGVAHQG
jgi:hypothetical protein